MMDIIKINICVFYSFHFFENCLFTLKFIKNKLLRYYSFSKSSNLFLNSLLRINHHILSKIYLVKEISFIKEYYFSTNSKKEVLV